MCVHVRVGARVCARAYVCVCVCVCVCMYVVRLDQLTLPCIALIQPSQLSCLGNSVVEHLPSKRYVVGSNPT